MNTSPSTTSNANKALANQYERLLSEYNFKPSEDTIRSLRQQLAHHGYAKNKEESAMYALVRQVSQQSSMQLNELKVLTQMFKQYSNTKSVEGTMDKKNFEICCQKLLNANSFLIDQLFRVMDTRNENYVDFNDFVVVLAVFISGTSQSKIELLFKIIDSDKNGSVEFGELKRIFKIVLPQQSDEYIDNTIQQVFTSVQRSHLDKPITSISRKEWKRIYDASPHLIQVFNHFMLQSFPREMSELGLQ